MIWLPTLSVVVVSFFCCNRGFLAADKVYLGELQGGYGVFWPVDRKGYYHPPYCKPYYNTRCLKNLCVSCNITAIARAGCLLVNKVGLDTRSYSVTKYFSFTFFFYVKELPGTLQISLGSDHAKLCWFSECCREGVRAYYIYQCSCTPPKGKEKVWISSECSCNSVSYHFKMSNDFRNLKLALTNCR